MPKFVSGGDESKQRMQKRIYILGSVFALFFAMLIIRAIFLNIKYSDKLQQLAIKQYHAAVKKNTQRGKIFDRNNVELAVDLTLNSLYANPSVMPSEKRQEISKQISKLLGLKSDDVYQRLDPNKKFVWIKRYLSEKETQEIKALNIRGLDVMEENKRHYPNEKLAAQVLGAVGFDSEGLGGVELSLKKFLVDSDIGDRYRRDARGKVYLSPSDLSEGEPPGSVELTIDRHIQYVTERELSAAVVAANAQGGTAIVLNPNTGEILAMANYPIFDPNNYNDYPHSHWRNRAVADSYEPGSTFKAVSIAVALDLGLVKPGDIFNCENGKMMIGNKWVKDSHAHGELSVSEIIKVSSNIGAYKVGKVVGKDRLYDRLLKFGFGKKTGIELPAESAGILSSSGKWSEMQFANIFFGQGLSATPLQMTAAFAALVNGGELISPSIVKSIRDGRGNIIKSIEKKSLGQVISLQTSSLMRSLLQLVTEKGGTGTLAATPEYGVGGKTGTAQKVRENSKGYAKGLYYSSFIGFGPAENPELVVYVGIDEPKGQYYGGQIAAPVFRKILEAGLHQLKVPPKPAVNFVQREDADGKIDIKKSEGVYILKTQGGGLRIPDFAGLTMKEVLQASHNIDLRFSFEGSGVAVSQSPKAGEILKPGSYCKVFFEQRFE